MATGAAPTGFVGWLTTYGSIIGFMVQVAFYLVVGTAALWAAITFNRLVKFTTGGAAKTTDKKVSVDEFVE